MSSFGDGVALTVMAAFALFVIISITASEFESARIDECSRHYETPCEWTLGPVEADNGL